MILKTLLVVNARLDGHRAADEKGVAHFHSRHEVVVVAVGMDILHISTQEDAILSDVVTTACTYAKIIINILAGMVIACCSIKQEVIGNEATSLALYAKANSLLPL